DQATQVALIQHALSQGQPQEAMRHFDIALTTSWSSQQGLFPLMANAMVDQAMSDALVERLQLKPVWATAFVQYVVERGPDPVRADRLAREFLDPQDPDQFGLIGTHLSRLAAAGEYDRAWQTSTHFDLADSAGAALRNGNFEQAGG